MNRFFLLVIVFSLSSFASFAQTYEELVNKSLDYLEAKEYEAAEITLMEAMRKEPANKGNALLLSNLGTIQRKLGKYDKALISYNSVLVNFPNTIFALQNRAALYCEIDSLEAAKRDYSIILSIDDDNIDALYSRGLIYMSEKNLLAAEEDFENILKIDSENIQAQSSLAFLLKSRGDWTEAEDKYTDLIYKYKKQPIFYVNRAECYLELRKLARAKADLQKAHELGYDDALLYILRGQLNLFQFDKLAAKADFLTAQKQGANPELIRDYLKMCK